MYLLGHKRAVPRARWYGTTVAAVATIIQITAISVY